MSVLLLEGPKSPNSMICGFLDPWEPLFIDLNIQNTSKIQEDYGNIFENIMFANMRIDKFESVGNCVYHFWNFGISNLKFWNLGVLNCLNFESLKIEMLEFGEFETWHVKMTFGEFVNWKMETWHF